MLYPTIFFVLQINLKLESCLCYNHDLRLSILVRFWGVFNNWCTTRRGFKAAETDINRFIVLYPAGIASVLVVFQQACFKWYSSGTWQDFTQLTWQKSSLPQGMSVKLQQRGNCQVHVLIPQKMWWSFPLTCQLVKQGIRAKHAACTGWQNLPFPLFL